MKKLSSFALLALTVLLLASCGNTKNIPYFQNSNDFKPEDSKFLYDARIMPKDLLTITVSTVNPEAAAPFNQTVPTPINLNTACLAELFGRQLWLYRIPHHWFTQCERPYKVGL